MKRLLTRMDTERTGYSNLDYAQILIQSVHVADPEMRVVGFRFVAAHATPESCLTAIDKEFALAKIAYDYPVLTVFVHGEYGLLRLIRKRVASDRTGIATLRVIEDVLDEMLEDLPICSDMHIGVGLIGEASIAPLCNILSNDGGVARKVVAIGILSKIYRWVSTTMQVDISSALDAATQRAPKSKRIAAAVTAAKVAIRSSSELLPTPSQGAAAADLADVQQVV
jgi:hypothetical protein